MKRQTDAPPQSVKLGLDVPSLPEEVLSVPEGDWIVLSADEQHVVAHHPDLASALSEAEKKGESRGIIMKAHGLGAHWVI